MNRIVNSPKASILAAFFISASFGCGGKTDDDSKKEGTREESDAAASCRRFNSLSQCIAACGEGVLWACEVKETLKKQQDIEAAAKAEALAKAARTAANTAGSEQTNPGVDNAEKPAQGSGDESASDETQFGWISDVRKNCEDYRSSPNEIKKSSVFNKNNALLAKAKIVDGRGVLRKVSTNQGGSEVSIAVKSGAADFATRATAAVMRGTPLYNKVADLTPGQCVIFSAVMIESSSIFEESQVCDMDYFAKFTAIKPCP